MEFGLDKCKIIDLKKGTLNSSNNFNMDNDKVIESLNPGDNYKYLGIMQLRGINHSEIKVKLIDDFKKRIQAICKTNLTSANKIKAINTYAIPTLTYSFGIIKWSATDLESICRTTRVILTKYRMHHPNSAIERISLPIDVGGVGILDIHRLHQSQIKSLR
ncbi:unnamed protein product, partial [Psylliodes chrysocephalus]